MSDDQWAPTEGPRLSMGWNETVQDGFNAWMAHVDAGRIGPNAKAKEAEVTEPAPPRLRTFGLNSPEAYEVLTGRRWRG